MITVTLNGNLSPDKYGGPPKLVSGQRINSFLTYLFRHRAVNPGTMGAEAPISALYETQAVS